MDVRANIFDPEQVSAFQDSQKVRANQSFTGSASIFQMDYMEIRQILGVPRPDTVDEFDKSVVEQKLREQHAEITQLQSKSGNLDMAMAKLREALNDANRDKEELIADASKKDLDHIDEVSRLNQQVAFAQEQSTKVIETLEQANAELQVKFNKIKQESDTNKGFLEGMRKGSADQQENLEKFKELLRDRDKTSADANVAAMQGLESAVREAIEGTRLRETEAVKALDEAERLRRIAEIQATNLYGVVTELQKQLSLSAEESNRMYEEGLNESMEDQMKGFNEKIDELETEVESLRLQKKDYASRCGGWIGQILDTAVLKDNYVLLDTADEPLFEEVLQSRNVPLKFSDVNATSIDYQVAKFADYFVSNSTLDEDSGPDMLRLMHFVLGFEMEEASNIAKLQWLARFVDNGQSQISKLRLLMIYNYLYVLIDGKRGMEFAMACSLLANLVAKFPLHSATATLISQLGSFDDHINRDRLSKLCIVRIALALSDEEPEIRDDLIKSVGFQPSRAQRLSWHSPLAEMAKVLCEVSNVNDDWAIVGHAKDAEDDTVEVCIFRNATESTNLILVNRKQQWVGSTLEIELQFDTRTNPDELWWQAAIFGPKKDKDVFYWNDRGYNDPLVNFMRQAYKKERSQLTAAKLKSLWARKIAALEQRKLEREARRREDRDLEMSDI